MRQFRAPEPNRHGRFEVHDVIPRKEAWYRARGWTEVGEEPEAVVVQDDLPKGAEMLISISGPWLKARKQIMDDTGLDLPKTKAPAIEALKAAGYEVR